MPDIAVGATLVLLTCGAVSAQTGWSGYNNTLTSERFSPLAQITPANVAGLREHCTYTPTEAGNFQTGPVVVDGVMFVTTDLYTHAIDAATCALKWTHHYAGYTPNPMGLRVNRGVAHLGGRVFRGVNDGYVYAHDAATGKQLWRMKAAEPNAGESLPAAPVAWNGMVFIGQAGGDNAGVRGRMMAFDAGTGTMAWSFDLVPMTGPASDTWPPSTATNPRTGGATWTSYTIDPTEGLLYVPAGNPAPDFDLEARPGLNLYTNAIVILDAKSGALRAHYQVTPKDFHDWDVSAAAAVVTTRGGRKIAASAGKDGLLHAIDLAAKKVIFATPVTTRTNVDTPLTPQGTRFCPGTQGGTEWNGPAWNASMNLLFVGAVDACSTVKLPATAPPAKPGAPFTNAPADAPFGTLDPKDKRRGWITAIDADSGAVKWKHERPAPVLAGVTATASGLVFSGDLAGHVFALDAATGKPLFSVDTGQPIAGGVITYSVGGRQFVAVAAGMTAMTWETKGTAKMIVYALPASR